MKLRLEDLATLLPTTDKVTPQRPTVTAKIIVERLANKARRTKSTFVLQLRDKHPGLRHPTIDIIQCFHSLDKAEETARALINTYLPHRTPYLSFLITEAIVSY